MKIEPGDSLVISGAGFGDTLFDSDRGSWNVTNALRDCLAGCHGLYKHLIDETVASSERVDVDENKIAAMVADRARLERSLPLIFIEEGHAPDGRPLIWLIDGHHRVRALQRLGHKACTGFVIEENAAKEYRVYFNGERVAPWMKETQT